MKKILKDESSSPKNRGKRNDVEFIQELELLNVTSETKTKGDYSQKFL